VRIAEGDFVLPVDKSEGPTSHDVVVAARRALGTGRVGHSGTLDPFASGLLLLCVGRATRLAEFLSGLDKEYEAVARLGIETDTLDREGEVVREVGGVSALGRAEVEDALTSLVGAVEQVPPQFSAKKVDGEPMHRRARRGERRELAPVPVTIYGIELHAFECASVRFTVRCSSGTYIRSLARDLGTRLGVGAHLSALRRTRVGSFSVADALGLDALGDATAVEARRIEPASAVGHMRRVMLDEGDATRLRHGQRLRLDEDGAAGPAAGPVAVIHDGDLLAIGVVDDGVLRPRKVFAS
jgi:tRNA pseudouridine55 synthase